MSKQTKLEYFIGEFSSRISESGATELKAEFTALNTVAEAAEQLIDEQTSLTANRGEKTEAQRIENDLFYMRAIAKAEHKLSEALETLRAIRQPKEQNGKQ